MFFFVHRPWGSGSALPTPAALLCRILLYVDPRRCDKLMRTLGVGFEPPKATPPRVDVKALEPPREGAGEGGACHQIFLAALFTAQEILLKTDFAVILP